MSILISNIIVIALNTILICLIMGNTDNMLIKIASSTLMILAVNIEGRFTLGRKFKDFCVKLIVSFYYILLTFKELIRMFHVKHWGF